MYRRCIARHHRESAQGECKQGERRESAAGHVGAGHTKQRRDLGGTEAGGGRGQHCAVGRRHWGAVGGYCTAGESRAAP